MIKVTPAAEGEPAAKHEAQDEDSDSGASDVSAGGTIRRNVSVAQALTSSEHEDLMKWATLQDGPWREDVRHYPGPSDTEKVPSSGSTALVESKEPYFPVLSGYPCELFRNEYLAWCGAVQLPSDHPDVGKTVVDLTGQLIVHGGLTIAAPKSGRIQFDCNHASTDLVPYASFVSSQNDAKRIGNLASAGALDPKPNSLMAPPNQASGLRPPNTKAGLLSIPKAGLTPLQPKSATYKDYAFARCELEKLAGQLRSREDAST
mmetsp:Transcript_15767/g.34478  ORF Transcript_15767/g.34478 Transcript_15767/m.34478 type:complete len:261 (-) Transcript_15767:46-828(-)